MILFSAAARISVQQYLQMDMQLRETPDVSMMSNAYEYLFSEYFNHIITGHEKVVIVSALAYDACSYIDKNYTMQDYFTGEIPTVDIRISKMFASITDDDVPIIVSPFPIVELFSGKTLPNEENLLKSYTFDQCMVYNPDAKRCPTSLIVCNDADTCKSR
jgi:hypothetical protein